MASEVHHPSLTLAETGPVERTLVDAPWPNHLLLVVFTLIWGANFVLAEAALREMTPIAFSVSRFVMGGAGLVAILYLPDGWLRRGGPRGRGLPRIARRDWPMLLFIAVIGALLAPWFGIEGLALTYAGRAALWLALAPAFSALIGSLAHTESISMQGRVGLVLAGLGTVGMAADGLRGEGYWLGDFLLLAAMIMAVSELHLIRPLAFRYGAARVVAMRTFIGGMLYVAVASPSLATQAWLSFSPWTWVAIVAGGFVGVGVGQWVKVRALRAIGATQVVIYGNMVPVATLLIAWATIGSRWSLLEILAGLLIVVGALCTQLGAAPTYRKAAIDAPAA